MLVQEHICPIYIKFGIRNKKRPAATFPSLAAARGSEDRRKEKCFLSVPSMRADAKTRIIRK